MDLHKLWTEMDLPAARPQHRVKPRRQASHPVDKLTLGLKINIGYTAIFLLVFAYLGWASRNIGVVSLFLWMTVFIYLIYLVWNIHLHRKVRRLITFDGPVLQSLRNVYTLATSSLKAQRQMAVFLYPISVTAGFLMGLSEGEDFEVKLQATKTHVILLVTVLIATPLCYWLAAWMEKVSFGKYLAKIKTHIDELEREG